MRPENRDGEGECYQVNSKVRAVYSDKEKKLKTLTINHQPVAKTKTYSICLQNYHFGNCQSYLNIGEQELLAKAGSKVITTSAQQVLEEYLRNHPNSSSRIEGRLVYQ